MNGLDDKRWSLTRRGRGPEEHDANTCPCPDHGQVGDSWDFVDGIPGVKRTKPRPTPRPGPWYIYKIVGLNGEGLVWIGQTTDTRRRAGEHRRGKNGQRVFGAGFRLESLEKLGTRDEALDRERELIEKWRPTYNIAGADFNLQRREV
jgi:predicted GIY-YIG superfamily endonuclease